MRLSITSTKRLYEWLNNNIVTDLSLLWKAMRKEDHDLVEFLLNRQDVLDLIDSEYEKNGKNIFFRAFIDCSYPIRLLILHNNVNKYLNKNHDGKFISPVEICTKQIYYYGTKLDEELLRLCVDHGLDVNLTDKFGRTYLMKLITSYYDFNDRYEDICGKFRKHELIEHTDCSVVDIYGNTALHYACIYNPKIASNILKKKEIDISVKNLRNETAVKYAILNNLSYLFRDMSAKDVSKLNDDEKILLSKYETCPDQYVWKKLINIDPTSNISKSCISYPTSTVSERYISESCKLDPPSNSDPPNRTIYVHTL